MRDYPEFRHHSTRTYSSDTLQGKGSGRRWRTVFVIFLAIFLTFASINGFVKTIEAGKAIARSKWDSTSTFAMSLSDKANSVLVFQKDPKRAVVLLLGNKSEGEDPAETSKNLSVALGAPVNNFIKFSDEKLTTADSIKEEYSKFKSAYTLIRILTGGWGDEGTSTNVSRIDAIKLWWQLKDVGTEELKFTDLSDISNSGKGNKNKKVLAVDTASMNRAVSEYFENIKVAEENFQINVVNASGDYAVSGLAANFVNAIGGRVGSITGDTSLVEECTLIVPEKSYTANYLEKVFDCDIKDADFGEDSDQINLILGSNFADKYFR